jgi:hypothetical protein
MKEAEMKTVRLSAGELDEYFISNPRLVHIERMDKRAFWIGVDTARGMVLINTGIDSRGMWYFNVEEDREGGQAYSVTSPRKQAKKEKEEKTTWIHNKLQS